MAIDTHYDGLTEAVVTSIVGSIFFKDAWDDADDDDKNAALKASVEAIEQLNYMGDKNDDDQTYQFPRNGDTSTPTDIHKAIVHNAIAIIDGRNPEMEFENLNTKSEKYGPVFLQKANQVSQEHLYAGIVSVTAWRYLVPYLRDNDVVQLRRV
jgi:hypothetical protein